MPLFEATSFSIGKAICNGSSCTEHTRSRIWNSFRQLLLKGPSMKKKNCSLSQNAQHLMIKTTLRIFF